MATISIKDPEAARSFIEALELPPPPPRVATRGGDEQDTAGMLEEPTLAVGSQLTEFSSGVAPAIRKDILNSFVVAQLAADSFIKNVGGGTKDWYERFFYVLANSGWDVNRSEDATRDASGTPQELRRTVVPILTAVLGDAVAATSSVIAVLKGLAATAAPRPWLTLFQRASQRASANQFQLGYVAGQPGALPSATLANFELDAQQSVTQILFFRFSSSQAKLRYSKAALTLNQPVFERVKPAVEERIREYRDTFIAAVDL